MRQSNLLIIAFMLAGCRPSDILRVPAPAGVQSAASLQSLTGAQAAYGGAKSQFFAAADGAFGLLPVAGALADEFTFSAFSQGPAAGANIDARATAAAGGFQEIGDGPWESLLSARSSLLMAIPGLVRFEPPSARSAIGEAYALVGYAEALIAESYCAGTPLDEVLPGGGIRFSMPLSTDSLLGEAQGHFDSAASAAHGDPAVLALASVGLARALLDRGQFAGAATAASKVPTGFVYNDELEPNASAGSAQLANFYSEGVQFTYERIFNVADREGGNGLNFVSAVDSRLTFDTTSYVTPDGTAWRLPTKFELNPSYVPLATGVEAALVVAEAELQTNPAQSLADLNVLRAAAPSTYLGLPSGLAPLADPGTDSGRVSLLFRERAFWLFGTGTRLGDLRRLIRQYGRDQSTVFPTGVYIGDGAAWSGVTPIQNYASDVALTLPTAAGLTQVGTIANPYYKGCLSPTKTA